MKHSPSPEKTTLELADLSPKLIGYICRIQGKTLVLNKEKEVYDAQTHEQVVDSATVHQVLQRRAEDSKIATEIRTKALALAHGDAVFGDLIRLQLASALAHSPTTLAEGQ